MGDGVASDGRTSDGSGHPGPAGFRPVPPAATPQGHTGDSHLTGATNMVPAFRYRTRRPRVPPRPWTWHDPDCDIADSKGLGRISRQVDRLVKTSRRGGLPHVCPSKLGASGEVRSHLVGPACGDEFAHSGSRPSLLLRPRTRRLAPPEAALRRAAADRLPRRTGAAPHPSQSTSRPRHRSPLPPQALRRTSFLTLVLAWCWPFSEGPRPVA